MKNKILFFATILFFFSLAVCTRGPSRAEKTEAIPFSMEKAKPGASNVFMEISESSKDKHVVEVRVDSAMPVMGYQFYFHFDPKIWEGEKASYGNFLQVEDAEFMPLGPEIDNERGFISFAAVSIGGQAEGKGLLATIDLRKKQSFSTTELALKEVMFSDPDAKEIPLNVQGLELRTASARKAQVEKEIKIAEKVVAAEEPEPSLMAEPEWEIPNGWRKVLDRSELLFSPEAVSVGDVDGDGKTEIVVLTDIGAGRRKFYTFQVIDGELVEHSISPPIWRKGDEGIKGLALGDTDGNGINEVFIPYSAEVLVRFEWEGARFVTKSTVSSGEYPIRAFAVGDADNDGTDELVIAADRQAGKTKAKSVKCRIVVFTWQEQWYEVEWGGSQTYQGESIDLFVGDTDNDRKKEIIIQTSSKNEKIHDLYLLQWNNETYQPMGYLHSDLNQNGTLAWKALGDVNHDGRREIVGRVWNLSKEDRTVASGIVVLGGTLQKFERIGPLDPFGDAELIALADLEKDGKIDVVLKLPVSKGAADRPFMLGAIEAEGALR
ncbi:MAG: hypothetical protein ACE5LC_07920 [Candidatus Aminicenantales bacterium]